MEPFGIRDWLDHKEAAPLLFGQRFDLLNLLARDGFVEGAKTGGSKSVALGQSSNLLDPCLLYTSRCV